MTAPLIVWPQDPTGNAVLGGKASALTLLALAGLPVPAFFTLTPAAFQATLDPPQAAALERHESIEGIGELIAAIHPPDHLAQAILAAFDQLCPAGGCVAVRSSAADEDSAGHSFAGQLESFLFVPRARLIEKIVAVWRSGFSPRIVAYRKQHGLPLKPEPPAVLVQKMVDAAAAGVAFAGDPVSGRRGVTLVSAVYGLATALVSGEADADTFVVDRSGQIIARTLAHKPSCHLADPDAPEGVRAVPVESDRADLPAISDAQVVAVAALARDASKYFGRPQDIEWAIQSDTLFLLQSRPITSLATMADPDGTRQIWDNSNIAESYAGVTTPLTFTFARHAYEGVYEQFCRLMRVPDAVIAGQHVMFANMLGLVRGRVYYNLLNWYRLLALLPGFTVNRAFMEQMMGVKEGLPENLLEKLAAATWQAKLTDALRLMRTLGGLLANHLTMRRQIAAFYARLEVAMAPPDPPLDQQRPDELVAYFRRLERQLLQRWDAPLVNDFFAMIFYGLLRKECANLDDRGTLQNALLCAEGGMVSAEPARRIGQMAKLIEQDHEMVELLCTGNRRAIEPRIRACPALESEYRSYLEKFGQRCLEELKLESATLHDDPLPLLRSIGHFARRLQTRGPAKDQAEGHARSAAEDRVKSALGLNLTRRAKFGWILRNARARVRDRENLRFERTRVFGRCREIFVELGRRFCADNLLDDPRDVFYLNLDEALGFVEGTATCTDLRALAALRKAEFGRYRSDLPEPADRFETRGTVYSGNRYQAEAKTAAPASDSDTRTGIGCCPGVVRGTARVIVDPRNAEIRQGEILVAARTDPGWIMLFPAAAGVAVEHGSLLSHSAIVAREMGIPAVVSVPGLTRWLQTGDLIELDGQTGTVRKVPPGGPGHEH